MPRNPHRGPHDGQNPKGRFTKNNKLGRGRPPGSRNRPFNVGPQVYFNGEIRTIEAGRFRSILSGIVSDLGGLPELSTGELQLARRCAQISVACEIMEQQAARGETFDVTSYGTLTGHLTTALKAIGLKRVPRDVTPTLRDYLTAVRQPDESDEEDGPNEP